MQKIQKKTLCISLKSMSYRDEASQPKEVKPKKVERKETQKIVLKKSRNSVIKKVKIKKKLEEKIFFSKKKKKQVKKKKEKKVQKKIDVPIKENILKKESAPHSEEYLQKNLQIIAQLIQENLYYPRRARKRGIQGEVVVQFILTKNATISCIKILSSTHGILSKASLETLNNIANKLPKPNKNITLTIPIQYVLSNLK